MEGHTDQCASDGTRQRAWGWRKETGTTAPETGIYRDLYSGCEAHIRQGAVLPPGAWQCRRQLVPRSRSRRRLDGRRVSYQHPPGFSVPDPRYNDPFSTEFVRKLQNQIWTLVDCIGQPE